MRSYYSEEDELERMLAAQDQAAGTSYAAATQGAPVANNPIDDAFNADDVTLASPTRKPLKYTPEGEAQYRLTSGAVPNSNLVREAELDLEEQAAADYDDESRRNANFSNGIAQAIAIATNTRAPTPGVVDSKLKELLSRRGQAQQRLHQQQGVALQERGLDVQEGKAANAAVAAERERVAAKAKEEADRKFAGEKFEETKRHNKETEGAAWAAAGRHDRAETRTVAKEAREQQEGLAYGWEKLPDSHATSKQLSDHATLVSSAEKMRGLTQQMRALLQANGGSIKRFVPGSEAYNSMNQLATMIGIEGKNIAELGALSGPDYALMQAVAANPTSIFTAGRDMNEVLTRLEQWGANSVEAKSKAIGVRRAEGATPTSEPGGSAGGVVVVKNKKNGKTKTLTREQAAKYLADPANFEEVK